MFLEATYPDYLDMINDGSYLPTKLMSPTVIDGQAIQE